MQIQKKLTKQGEDFILVIDASNYAEPKGCYLKVANHKIPILKEVRKQGEDFVLVLEGNKVLEIDENTLFNISPEGGEIILEKVHFEEELLKLKQFQQRVEDLIDKHRDMLLKMED